MAEAGTATVPHWDAEWTLFGPIPNEGNTATWPGKVGFNPLPLDGAQAIPREACILGRTYKPILVRSEDGELDFFAIFGRCDGCPIVYMMTEMESARTGLLPACFGANWGTQWWLNGKSIFNTVRGNEGDPGLRSANQFLAPLRKGKNVFVVKVVSGGPGWSITLGRLAIRGAGGSRTPVHLPKAPHTIGLARPTRDWSFTALRIEERPGPVPPRIAADRERIFARSGVDLHWVGIVHHDGSPYAPSKHLGCFFDTHLWDAEYPRILSAVNLATKDKRQAGKWLAFQVREAHRHGLAVISWFPGTHCRSIATAHPEWRTVPFAEPARTLGEDNWQLCVHSPYGEALTRFFGESLQKYDLDGFWVDGSRWANAARFGCACGYCRRRFEAEEGLAFPEKPDWHDEAFRRWVSWRYRSFMEFWGRVAGRLRREVPHAKVVINHLHRLGGAWQTAIPIDHYAAEVAVGTEAADSPFDSAFHARLVRAYDKPDGEVWMSLSKLSTYDRTWPAQSHPVYRYAHHSLACMTGGAMPSFGTPDPGETLADAFAFLAGLVRPRRDFVGGRGEPYLGLYLSQQAETFHFARRRDWGHPDDYWNTIYGWHNLVMERQLLQDIVFDGHVNPCKLSTYPVIVAPLAVALSDRQLRDLEAYVSQGGVLVTDPFLGACDEWGRAANRSRVKSLLGHPTAKPPSPDRPLGNATPGFNIRTVGVGKVVEFAGNVGLRFHQARSAKLADDIGALLARLAPPRLTVIGPRRLHVGMFRQPGRLILHLQNFIAYSDQCAIPNPEVTPPEPVKDVRVLLRGLCVHSARYVVSSRARTLKLTQNAKGDSELTIPAITWGETIELRI